MILDLEWKLIYVGSAESSDYDQVLDSVLVGPVPGGRHMFVFQVIYFLQHNKLTIFVNILYIIYSPIICSAHFQEY
jgi:hypothetical protein